jgi:ferredoxin
MVDGKALVDLRHLNQCDLDGHCVDVCPTDVVTLRLQPVADNPPQPQAASQHPAKSA